MKRDAARAPGLVGFFQSHRLGTAFLLLVVVHAPTLLAYGGGLARRGHYEFFPVIWIGLLVLVLRRGSPVLILRWHHLGLLLLDGLLLIVGSLFRSPWLGFAGFCAGCFAVLAAGRDKVTGRSLWPLTLLPLITLRPPLNLDTEIITHLQLTTTRAASLLLDQVGVLHYRRGVVLELPDRQLFVDEACSGIHSLFALLGLAALIVLVQRRHWIVSLLLLASAVLWALLLNLVRVVVIVLADRVWGMDLASGWPHDVLSYILLGIALACLLSTDRLLLLLTSRIENKKGRPREINPLVRAFNWVFRPPSEARRPVPDAAGSPLRVGRQAVLLVLGLIFVAVQLVGLLPRLQAKSENSGAEFLPDETLAGEYDGWRRGEYRTQQRATDSMWGARSCRWDFSRGARTALVSFDYLFQGWHELTDCYKNSGWKMTNREVRRLDALSGDWPLVVATMQDDLGQYGIVCFSLCDAGGQPVWPARDELAAGVAYRWRHATGQLASTYQAQAFSTGSAPPSEEDVESLVELHCQTRERLARQFRSGTN
jgi:exosortase